MIDELILIRYLAGDCSPVERKVVEQWITAEKTNAERFFELERIWNLKDELRFSNKKEISAAYDRLINRVERKEKTIPLRRLSLFSKWLGYAVAVVLLGLKQLKALCRGWKKIGFESIPGGLPKEKTFFSRAVKGKSVLPRIATFRNVTRLALFHSVYNKKRKIPSRRFPPPCQ